jgi:hypothetical protein
MVYLAAIKNPEKTANEILEIVTGQGMKTTIGSVSSIRTDFIRCCTFLAEQGLLKNPFVKVSGQ